jgi:hypothetical protein
MTRSPQISTSMAPHKPPLPDISWFGITSIETEAIRARPSVLLGPVSIFKPEGE